MVDGGAVLGDLATIALATGDVDADGDLDLVETRQQGRPGALRTWINDGNGAFASSLADARPQFGSISVRANLLKLSDMDADGDLDAVLTVQYPNFPHVDVSYAANNGDGTFASEFRPGGGGPNLTDATIADVSGEGRMNVLTVSGGQIGVFNSFRNTFLTAAAPSAIATGDLDGDGHSDLVVGSSQDERPATVWLNTNVGEFEMQADAFGALRVNAIELADIDADGDLDAVLGHLSSPEDDPISVFVNDGLGNFESSGQVFAGIGTRNSITRGLSTVDMDGDGAIDILVAATNADGTMLHWFRNELIVRPDEGDFNANGTVEQGDLDLVLLYWGQDGATISNAWAGPMPGGLIDQDELDAVLLHWGSGTAGLFTSGTSPAEPAPLVAAAELPKRGSLEMDKLKLRSSVSMRYRVSDPLFVRDSLFAQLQDVGLAFGKDLPQARMTVPIQHSSTSS